MDIALEDTFGDIVRKASRGTKTSLDALSKETGVDATLLSKFLADAAQPTAAEASAIAAALGLDGAKLTDSGLQKWYPQQSVLPAWLSHQVNTPQPSNGYFLILRDKQAGAFVDPAGNPDAIIEGFKRAGVALQYILLTHKHADHSDALAAVRRAFPAATPVIHELDGKTLGAVAFDAMHVVDGASVPFGDGEIHMAYTPGHTDGSSCFLYKGCIFTGDTMFAGSVGGLFGDRFGYADLLRSVRMKILTLPPGTTVLPGHGPSSTVAAELAHNPFFS